MPLDHYTDVQDSSGLRQLPVCVDLLWHVTDLNIDQELSDLI